jgi:hypothetical protein
MHVLGVEDPCGGREMRRIILALGASVAVVVSFVMVNAATSAAPPITAHGFALNGSVAGGVTSAQSGQPLTFVFTEKNVGTTAQTEDLILESLSNASIVSIGCKVPGGAQINPDGQDCEPGFVHPNQVAASVINATITASTGTVAARLCLSNEGTGVVGPCQTLTVSVP